MKMSDIVKETAEMASASVASSMGSGNGFVNGGPGTLARSGSIKKSKKKKATKKKA